MVTDSNVIFSDIINTTLVYIDVCAISTPYLKCNESYELEKNYGSNGT